MKRRRAPFIVSEPGRSSGRRGARFGRGEAFSMLATKPAKSWLCSYRYSFFFPTGLLDRPVIGTISAARLQATERVGRRAPGYTISSFYSLTGLLDRPVIRTSLAVQVQSTDTECSGIRRHNPSRLSRRATAPSSVPGAG